MFKWFCKHDFVTVESKNVEFAIKEVILKEKMTVDPRNLIYTSKYPGGKVLEDKVCLKCKLCYANLSNFREEVKNYTPGQINKLTNQVIKMQNDAAYAATVGRNRVFLARGILKEHFNGKKNK